MAFKIPKQPHTVHTTQPHFITYWIETSLEPDFQVHESFTICSCLPPSQATMFGKYCSTVAALDKGCAVRFVDYIARFSTYIVNLSTIIGEISQDNPQISSPQTWTRFFFSSFLISNWRELKIDRQQMSPTDIVDFINKWQEYWQLLIDDKCRWQI